MKVFFRDTLMTLIIIMLAVFGLQVSVESVIVNGSSMLDNFHDGQRILASKIAYKFHEPERGDVIVFYPPSHYGIKKNPYIKRIIGLPGESIEIKDGIVFIHKETGDVVALDEPYITERATRPFEGDIIPEKEYFVLGDNRQNSDDSRNNWTVPRQNIIGKAWLSIWPPEQWGLTKNYQLQDQIDLTTSRHYSLR